MAALFSESARQAGHVLLDALIAIDVEDPDAGESALLLALERMGEVAPISVQLDSDGNAARVDDLDFLMGVLMTMQVMLVALEEATGKSQEELVHAVRFNLDRDDLV